VGIAPSASRADAPYMQHAQNDGGDRRMSILVPGATGKWLNSAAPHGDRCPAGPRRFKPGAVRLVGRRRGPISKFHDKKMIIVLMVK
jgi:hypothetical protein